MNTRWLVLLGVAAALLLSCTSEGGSDIADVVGGSGTETVGILGVFVDSTDTPVADARVIATVADSVIDTVYTDRDGAYLIDSLRVGPSYDLFAALNDSVLVAYVVEVRADTLQYLREGADSLLVVLDDGVSVPAGDIRTDTMYAPGSISGQVATADGSGVMGARVYIPGTSLSATVAADGRFVMTGVPPGTYSVVVDLDGYTPRQLDPVTVRSGQDTPLSRCVLAYDPGLAPRAPSGLDGVYDTLSATLCVWWQPVVVADLAGYLLYADTGAGTIMEQMTLRPIGDTSYCLTIFADLLQSTDKQVRVQVKAVDTLGNQSLFSEVLTTLAPSPTLVRTTIAVTAVDSATVADTLTLSARIDNPTRRNQSITWYVDEHAADSIVRQVIGLDVRTYTDTLRYHWQDSGVKWVFVDVLDDGGARWTDSVRITVTGVPIPTDTTVAVDSLTVARRSLVAGVCGETILAVGGIYDLVAPPSFEPVPTPLATVEAFSMTAAQWQPRTDLAQPRYAAAAVTMGDTLYVLGGSGAQIDYTSVVGYDAGSDQWFDTPTHMPAVRHGVAACAVDGWIYLFGGITFGATDIIVSDAIDRFNPRTGAYESFGTMREPRAYHQVVGVGDTVFIMGGLGGADSYLHARPLASVELLTPVSSGATIDGPSMLTPRLHFAAVALDRRVYVMGGVRTVFMDTPIDGVESLEAGGIRWLDERPLPGALHSVAAVTADHSIWIIGGSSGTQQRNLGQRRTVMRYYP